MNVVAGTPLSTPDDIHYALWELDFEAFNSGITTTGPTFMLMMGDGSARTWTGSGSRSVLLLDTGSSDSNASFFSATVNFSNGSATVPWSNFRVIRYN